MRKFLLIALLTSLSLPLMAQTKEVRYVEKNYFDTLTVSGRTMVIRRDELRRHYNKYVPERAIVSYNDMSVMTSPNLKRYINSYHYYMREKTRKVWLSGAAFPFYKPSTSAGLGAAGIMSFDYDRRDPANFKSFASASILASIKGQFDIGAGANLYMKGNSRISRARIDTSYGLANYFGTGDNMLPPDIDDERTQYTHFIVVPKLDMLWRVAKGFYIGPTVFLQYEKLSDIMFAYDGPNEILYAGAGVMGEFSTVDNPTFPYRGVVFNASVSGYAEFLSIKEPMLKVCIDYRQYAKVTKRGVIAWQVQAQALFNNSTDLFILDPSVDMRGVLDRYYVAPTVGTLSLEYRQFIGSEEAYRSRKWWSRIGFTAWANVGVWGDDIFKNPYATVAFGAGLRFEVQPNKNFRFDVGRAIGKNPKVMYYVGFLEYF